MSWIFNLVAHLFADLPKRMYGLASAGFEQLVYHDVLSSDIVSSLPSHSQLRGSSVFGGGRQKYVPASVYTHSTTRDDAFSKRSTGSISSSFLLRFLLTSPTGGSKKQRRYWVGHVP